MTQEEKAKEFDASLERAKKLIETCDSTPVIGWCEYIFPMLKESEWERIRNNCIHFINLQKKHHAATFEIEECIAWLEKQGKNLQCRTIIEAWKDMRLEVYQQASGNRHEPNYSDDTTKMFSLNDIDEIIEKINEQTEKQSKKKAVDCENTQQEDISQELETEDERIRKEIIAFLKENYETGRAEETWSLSGLERWIAWLEKQNHDGKKWIYEDVYIKEKEQLIQDGIDEVLENPQKYGLEKQGEQKPAWSEEDEDMLDNIIDDYDDADEHNLSDDIGKVMWLKSLKQRML